MLISCLSFSTSSELNHSKVQCPLGPGKVACVGPHLGMRIRLRNKLVLLSVSTMRHRFFLRQTMYTVAGATL
jgi:hypothetical protein